MKNKIFVFLIFLSACCENERKITVIIPSYNNAQWYKDNLHSVFFQEYSNYAVKYIDDCSTDGTGELVKEYVKKCGQEFRTEVIINKERLGGALGNRWKAIHSCDDNDIIVSLDGDDWLVNNQVFKRLNLAYSNPNTWWTFGSSILLTNQEPTRSGNPYPNDVIKTNSFRQYKGTAEAAHLKTFYAWLFKQIKLADLLHQGKFFPAAEDCSWIYPMLEMSGSHTKFIPDILYIYNHITSGNIDKKDPTIQAFYDHLIHARPRYQPLREPVKKPIYTTDIIITTPDVSKIPSILDSIKDNVTDFSKIFVLSNDTSLTNYILTINTIKDAINNSSSKFILLINNPITVKINLNSYMQVMTKTWATVLLLNNIDTNLFYNLIDIGDNNCALQFKNEAQYQITDFVLCNKKNLINKLDTKTLTLSLDEQDVGILFTKIFIS